MDFTTVMNELKALGNERLKKIYMSYGAHEPLFGVATGAMKPLARKIKIDQQLSFQLYDTGNYDAMYFAGIIANPKTMTEEDFNRWIDKAYFYMLSDFVVSVTLAETDIAQDVADKWIASGNETKMSAGWSCYCWLLGYRPDSTFNKDKILKMLNDVSKTINDASNHIKLVMINFVYTVGISYLPLHQEALNIAQKMGPIQVKKENQKTVIINPYENIQKDIAKGRIGFKRKYVRC